MRVRYLVCYDISDPQRLRRVHRKMCGFGEPLQYSVFQCDLSDAERILLIEALTPVINQREDQVLLVDLGPAEARGNRSFAVLGRPLTAGMTDCVAVIV